MHLSRPSSGILRNPILVSESPCQWSNPEHSSRERSTREGETRMKALLLVLLLPLVTTGNEVHPDQPRDLQATLSVDTISYIDGDYLGKRINLYGDRMESPNPWESDFAEQPTVLSPTLFAHKFMVSDVSEFSEAMTIGGGVSVSKFGAHLSTSAQYMESHYVNTSHLFLSVVRKVTDGGQRAPYQVQTSPRLTESAKSLLKTEGPKAFDKRFGRYFVSGFRRSRWIVGTMEIYTSQYGSQSEVKDTITAGFNLWGANVEATADFDRILKSATTHVVVRSYAMAYSWTGPEFPSDAIELMKRSDAVMESLQHEKGGDAFETFLYPFSALPDYQASLGSQTPLPDIPQNPQIAEYIDLVNDYRIKLQFYKKRIVDIYGGINHDAGRHMWDYVQDHLDIIQEFDSCLHNLTYITDHYHRYLDDTLEVAISTIKTTIHDKLDCDEAVWKCVPGFDETKLCRAYDGGYRVVDIRISDDFHWRRRMDIAGDGYGIGTQILNYNRNLVLANNRFQFERITEAGYRIGREGRGNCLGIDDFNTAPGAGLILRQNWGDCVDADLFYMSCDICWGSTLRGCKFMNHHSKMCLVGNEANSIILQYPCTDERGPWMYWNVNVLLG